MRTALRTTTFKKSRLNSYANSVLFHSRKWTFPYVASDTLRAYDLERKSHIYSKVLQLVLQFESIFHSTVVICQVYRHYQKQINII